MLDPKYIPLFIGGFIAWICFMIFVGWITSRGKNEGSSFLTGGGNLGFFLIFCTVGATMIGTGSSMGAIGNGFNHGWGRRHLRPGCIGGYPFYAAVHQGKEQGLPDHV